MTQKLTINTVLNFSENDDNIISYLQELRETRKIGDFITYCIKNYTKTHDFQATIESTNQRIAQIEQQLAEIRAKTTQVHSLIGIGKRLGLEETNKRLMLGEFIINKQIKEISNTFQISTDDFNERYAEYEKPTEPTEPTEPSTLQQAEDIIEYILLSYDGLMGELVEHAREGFKYAPQQEQIISHTNTSSETQNTNTVKIDTLQDGQDSRVEPIQETTSESKVESKVELKDEPTEEVVSFGEGVDLSDLMSFVGF